MAKIALTQALCRSTDDRRQVLDTLRFMLDGSLTENPRRRSQGAVNLNDLAWVFVAGRDFQPVAVRTYDTLERKMAGGAVYFTPNTFYARHERTSTALRWLNALYVDIDDPDMTLPDVLDRARDAGLPLPTLINKTPNGVHVYWKIRRVRATRKALALYTALLKTVTAAMDGDQAAATSERLLRIPTATKYYNAVEYGLQAFRDWRDINAEVATQGQEDFTGNPVMPTGILRQPAIMRLLEGVEEGRRDNTAFTLALAFKAAGRTPGQALDKLTTWNFRNQPPLPYSQIRSKVRSAYKSKYRGPSAYWIRQLSGMPFKYHIIAKKEDDNVTGKRPPGRPDLKPAAREKLLAMLRENGGSIQARNQVELGKQLGVSGSTTFNVVAGLKKEGLLKVQTQRLGKARGAITTYTLLTTDTCAPNPEIKADTGETITPQQPATHYGGAAGGALRPPAADRKDNVITFPGSRSGRDQGAGAG